MQRWAGHAAGFRVHTEDTGIEARVVDFSAEGLGLALPRTARAEKGALSLVLARGEAPFARVTIAIANAQRGAELRVGGPILRNEPLTFGVARGASIGDRAPLDDESIVGDVLDRLHTHDPILRLVTGDGRVRAARVRPSHVRAASLPLIVEGSPTSFDASAVLAFDLHGGAFLLRGTLVRRGNEFDLEGPFRLESRSRRRCDRVHVPLHRGVVSWPHALIPGQKVVADIEDISPRAARVRIRRRQSSFPPPPFEPLQLHVDGLAFSAHGFVRHIDTANDGSTMLGLELSPESTDETIRLARAVEQVRFPKLRPRARVPRPEVIDLLSASGYLALREPAQQLVAWHDASSAACSVDAVHVREDGAVDGHLSTTRIYDRTWIFHQLATLGEGATAMECRRALYLSSTGWVSLLAEGRGYALAYFDRKKRWHATFFEGFIRWAGADALATLVPLDRFEPREDETKNEPSSPSGAWDVGHAYPEERALAMRAIEDAMPAIMRNAMSLEVDELVTPQLCEAHAAEGLERTRSLLVVREDGEPTAFAVCETGSPRLSLFNLFNTAHLFVTPRASDGAQRALIAEVRAFYAARGVPRPLIVARPRALTAAERAGLVLAETMGSIVFSSEGLKQYMNFLTYHFGRFTRR